MSKSQSEAEYARSRTLYLVAIIAVIVVGLPSRMMDDMPDYYVQYLGDALWALMIFLLFGLLLPTVRTRKTALLALAVTWGIEFSQFYDAQWIRSIRYATLGGLILGFQFRWTDLVAYSCGIGVGVLLERGVLLKRRIKLLVFLAIVAGIVAFVLYVAVAITVFANFVDAFTGCPPEEPAEIEYFGGFTLPPSANNLYSYCSGMQNWFATARFEMSPEDLEEFVASTRLEEPLSSSAPPEVWENPVFPQDVESYLYGKYEHSSPPDYYAQEILIDTSNPDAFIVHVLTEQG
jgi:hypothetical protein